MAIITRTIKLSISFKEDFKQFLKCSGRLGSLKVYFSEENESYESCKSIMIENAIISNFNRNDGNKHYHGSDKFDLSGTIKIDGKVVEFKKISVEIIDPPCEDVGTIFFR